MVLGKRMAVLMRHFLDGPDLNVLLGARGFQVYGVEGDDELVEVVTFSHPDVVVIVGPPDRPSLPRVVQAARASGQTILAVVWPGVPVDEAVSLLEVGIDYVAPSFHPDWLAAQIHALLRRVGYERAPANVIDLGYLHIDLGRRLVTVNGREVPLTRTEFAVLRILAERPGTVMPSGEIMQQIMGVRMEEAEAQDLLKVHIHRLRQKLEHDQDNPRFIRTVRGHGYMYAFERRAKERTLEQTEARKPVLKEVTPGA